jgi:putative PIN family toxin of toxin-antitoxin system
MRIVLDTNVLISGIINPMGCPGRIVDLLASGVLELVIDVRIMAEYADVLGRKWFERYIGTSERKELLEFLANNSCKISCSQIVRSLPDPGDIAFLETALSMNVALVTGNLKHYPQNLAQNCLIQTPRQFIDTYQEKTKRVD